MINNLQEAIVHAREKAEELKERAFSDFDSWTDEGKVLATNCLECAAEHEQLAAWLTELQKRRETEPIVYVVTENSQGFTVETNDDRNIGLKKVSTTALIYAMQEITEKYWDKGLRVVFKYYCGNGDEWEKIYETSDYN